MASFCLALALIAANLIYAALLNQGTILEGSPGELLYASAFSGFQDEWELYEGQQSAKIVDEQLELTVSAAQTATWSAARHRFRDFDLSVSATASRGPIDNAFGVVFQVQDRPEGACDLPAVILCEVDRLLPLVGAAIRQVLPVADASGYYAFLISSDGYYSLWKTEAGRTKLASAWIASPHIHQGLGAANRLRAVARGSRYRFFINDAQVSVCIPDEVSASSTYVGGECIDGDMLDVYEDELQSTGKLGVMAQSTSTGGGGVGVGFDNVIVLSPAEPSDEDAKA
jgi:hypothetical protein